jgi:hypothetical protein
MGQKQPLLLIKKLPLDLATRLEGTDPNIITAMEIQRALLERQTNIVRNGDAYIPSVGELFDQYFGKTPTPHS